MGAYIRAAALVTVAWACLLTIGGCAASTPQWTGPLYQAPTLPCGELATIRGGANSAGVTVVHLIDGALVPGTDDEAVYKVGLFHKSIPYDVQVAPGRRAIVIRYSVYDVNYNAIFYGRTPVTLDLVRGSAYEFRMLDHNRLRITNATAARVWFYDLDGGVYVPEGQTAQPVTGPISP